jgi:hypothetical protein
MIFIMVFAIVLFIFAGLGLGVMWGFLWALQILFGWPEVITFWHVLAAWIVFGIVSSVLKTTITVEKKK